MVIAGKGHEQGQEFADRTIPFDDREVARDALRRLQAAGLIPLALDDVRRLAPGDARARGGRDRGHRRPIDSRRVEPGDLFVAVGRGRTTSTTRSPRSRGGARARRRLRRARRARPRGSQPQLGARRRHDRLDRQDVDEGHPRALVRPHARTVVAEGSQNNEIGLPLTLGRIEPDTEVVVVEMGMRGIGQIAELCAIARPTSA